MPRIVSVWLEHWPVTRLRRSWAKGGAGAPEAPEPGPLVVAAPEASGLRLTAVDAHAQALGLRPGEPLARARARIGTPIAVHPADPEADAAALHRLCLWARRYTPVVSPFGMPEGGDGFFLDIVGASHLLGGEEPLLADLAARLARNAIPARVALADTPGCAFALARHGGGGAVPSGCGAQALRDLSVAALRLDPGLVQALNRLGLRRIGQLADAPRAPLARRFGETLLLRLDQALGHRPEPLLAADEPRALSAERGFLDPIGHQDAIVATVVRLMEGLADKLEAAGLGARALHLTLTRVDGIVRPLDLALSTPTRCAAQVGRLLDLRLDRLGSALDAGFGFETVRLAVTATGRMEARQAMLSASALPEGNGISGTIHPCHQGFGASEGTRVPSPRLRGEVRRHPVESAERTGEAEATVRGRIRVRLPRTRPLTVGCRLDVLPCKGETRPSPRKRGVDMREDRSHPPGTPLAKPPRDAGFPLQFPPALSLRESEQVASRHAGADAFGPGAPDAEGPGRLADALRQRIGQRTLRLGIRASHLPERADMVEFWRSGRPSPRRTDGVSTPLPPRPLVLLRRGEAAEDVIALRPDGPPQRFRWRRRLHRIAHADGPERIADEWWHAPAPHRDYYVLECEAGRRLWVYREGAAHAPARWFVHGLFA